jgi:hypothetical protein
MNELYAVLLSWATTLSGYPAPDVPAEIVAVSHEVLVERACGGRECKVLGWFPPGQRIYVDERLGPADDLVAASILVHEMVHYLQYRSGSFDGLDCAKSIELEREAYAIQREFLLRYGVYRPVGVNSHRVGCTLAHEAELDPPAVARDIPDPDSPAESAEPKKACQEARGREGHLTEQLVYSNYIDGHRQATSWLPNVLLSQALTRSFNDAPCATGPAEMTNHTHCADCQPTPPEVIQ